MTIHPHPGLGDLGQTVTDPCTWTDILLGPSATCCSYLASTGGQGSGGLEPTVYQWDCPQAPSATGQLFGASIPVLLMAAAAVGIFLWAKS